MVHPRKTPFAGKTTDLCSSTRQNQFKAYHELPGKFLSSLDDNKRKKIQQEWGFADFCQI